MVEPQRTVYGGVDTHKEFHVAAAIDGVGRVLGTETFPATAAGYRRLGRWLERHGQIAKVGVEGTGSYGLGLARALSAGGIEVVEVNRPNRQLRRRRGKSDTVDVEAAARAVLNGEATAVPRLLRDRRSHQGAACGVLLDAQHPHPDREPDPRPARHCPGPASRGARTA